MGIGTQHFEENIALIEKSLTGTCGFVAAKRIEAQSTEEAQHIQLRWYEDGK